jgi:hypothetical protein
MADERMPYQIIDDLAAAYSRLSDAKVLAKLAKIPPLADEGDPAWQGRRYWRRVAYPYLALWQVAAARRLRAAIPLMLDRACFGDPGEIMRNLCHALEGIVEPDWAALTELCIPALASPRAGTRLWAAEELGRLRDRAAIPALERAAQDEVPEVRQSVASALERMRSFSTYIGPFAEWLVPRNQRARRTMLRAHDLYAKFYGRTQSWLECDPNPPTQRVGRRWLIQDCWTVQEASPPANPRRKLTWVYFSPSDIGVYEYPGFDAERERQWFEQTFAEQLRRLAEVYRTEPSIKWGVVTRVLDG